MVRTSARRRKIDGDVHIGSMAGDVAAVPGCRTVQGRRAVADAMDQVLRDVRRHIRTRRRVSRIGRPAPTGHTRHLKRRSVVGP